MSLWSQSKQSIYALAFSAAATAALADNEVPVPYGPPPVFECWGYDDNGGEVAIFSNSMRGGLEPEENGTRLPDGRYAYPFQLIDDFGSPGLYDMKPKIPFFPELFDSFIENKFPDFSDFDRAAIRALIDAYARYEDERCPELPPAMLLS